MTNFTVSRPIIFSRQLNKTYFSSVLFYNSKPWYDYYRILYWRSFFVHPIVICFTLFITENQKFIIIIIIIIIISGSRDLVRSLATSHRRFRNLIKTLGRTPLDEWSARLKGLYRHRTTKQRNTRQISMSLAGFKPTIPVTKRPRPTP
jgi:hypothetical protein